MDPNWDIINQTRVLNTFFEGVIDIIDIINQSRVLANSYYELRPRNKQENPWSDKA